MDDERILAAILSTIVPGLGQLVLGETVRGLAFMLGSIVSIVLAFVLIATIILAPIGIMLPLAVWIGSIVDAAQEN